MKLDKMITYWRTLGRFKTIEQEFNKVHNNKYNYNDSLYKGSKENIDIICPLHGKFQQIPSHHLKGVGCPKCGTERTADFHRLSQEEFLQKAYETHGNKYDYSKTRYTGKNNKITIICPLHGEFIQSAYTHIVGCGCRKCAFKISDTNDFINYASTVHNDKYYYTNAIFTGYNNKIIITCPIHGDFEQVAGNHIKGHGCEKCGGSALSNTEEFINKSKLIHNNFYDYSKTEYILDFAKVIITCPIHGSWEQVARSHLNGSGCPSCAITGFDKNKPAILYYLSINNGEAYKIGITNRTVEERFMSDMQYIEVVYQIYYKLGKDAYEKEQEILKEYNMYKYKGPNLLKSGNTELFTEDIANYCNFASICTQPI